MKTHGSIQDLLLAMMGAMHGTVHVAGASYRFLTYSNLYRLYYHKHRSGKLLLPNETVTYWRA